MRGYITNCCQRFKALALVCLCLLCVPLNAQLPTSELPDVFLSGDYDEGTDVVADWCYAMLDSAAVSYFSYDIRGAEYWCSQAQKAIKDSTSYYYHLSIKESLELMKGFCPRSDQNIQSAIAYLEKVGTYRASKGLIMALNASGHYNMFFARPRAVQMFKRMGTVAQSIGDNSRYIFSLIYQSQAFSHCELLPQSAQKAREALRQCEGDPKLSIERFFSQFSLAIIYSRLKSSEMAALNLKKIEDEKVYERNYYIKMSYLLIKCDHLMTIRDFQKALVCSDQVLQMRELVATHIYDWRAYLQRCKLSTLLLRADESDYYAQKCESVMKVSGQFENNDRYTRHIITLSRAHNFVIRGEYQKAKDLLATIPYTRTLMHYPDFADAYFTAYERALIGVKDYRRASYMLNQHALLSDTIAMAHAKAREEDMAYIYKSDPTIIRQQTEISQQSENAQRIKYQSTFWMLLSILVVVLALIAFFYNKRRMQRANERKAMELQAQLQEEVESQTIELRRQNELISIHNADILRSQTYAKRIQQGLLPTREKLLQPGWFSAALIIFKPYEITSGDFYWYAKIGDRIILCAGDGAGHGIPGAMISMVALTLINDVAHRNGSTGSASFVLNEIYERMLNMMPNLNERNDVAITVAIYDVASKVLNVSSATQSMVYTHDNDVIPIYATKREEKNGKVSFGDEYCQLSVGDSCFFYTDGLISMLNGETNHKLKMTGLVEIIQHSLEGAVENRHSYIRQELNLWKGNSVQSDDVLLLGVTI